jgi:predicted permease
VTNLVLLVLCFSLGFGARSVKALPRDGFRVLNTWVLFVSLPALVLRAVHAVELRAQLFVGAATLWVVFALAAAAALVAIARRWSTAPVAGALALSAGLGNTAFVGLPMIEALSGPNAVATVQLATMIDQLGTFGALSFVAVPFAISLGKGTPTFRGVALRVLKFPPFLALLLALATRAATFPSVFEAVLVRLADMMSPLALASVGWQLNLSALRGQGGRLALGLGYKMVLAPALVFAMLWAVHPSLTQVERVTIVQAAMPPMVTSAVLAADNQLDPGLASGLIALGLFVAVVTVPLWWLLTGLVVPA